MCGITGFVEFGRGEKADRQAVLDRMTDSLRHRGPDSRGTGLWEVGGGRVGFGHRRLAVIDLSPGGHQPMLTEDGRYVIIFNGEVYNFGKVRSLLEAEGQHFRSRSDTEVVLRAFARWGEGAVDRFIGMFAFALLDREAGELWLFRDRAGVKPLYYFRGDGLFLFASELKAFHEHPGFRRELCPEALHLFLRFGYIPAPYSIFRGCLKLEPGCRLRLRLSDGQAEVRRYWSVLDAYRRPRLEVGFGEALEETEAILRSACAYRMIADVPVGLFLSGGYDSTAVAALLQSGRTERVHTFTVGFNDPAFNEGEHARAVARHLGTEHEELTCTEREALEIVPELPVIYDEPFADSSAVPTTLVSRMARRWVTVALSADAGDEVFGGYPKYATVLQLRRWALRHPRLAGSFRGGLLGRLQPEKLPGASRLYNIGTRYRKIAAACSADGISKVLKEVGAIFTGGEVASLLRDGASEGRWGKGNDPRTVFDEDGFEDRFAADEAGGAGSYGCIPDDLSRLLAVDYRTYMVDDILVKVDRATMSVSLEGREPLLDHRIVEYTARLPSDYKIRGGALKYLLKQIVHRHVPRQIMDRPKKGFGVPLARWLEGALKERVNRLLAADRLRRQGIFDPQAVEALRRGWARGGENPRKLWSLLMFQMWYERWME